MRITVSLREAVRERAVFRCEYCGVSEIDSGATLTIDHFHPQAQGGSDESDNLVYCCACCNQYKGDYHPVQTSSSRLWNPRRDTQSTHFLALRDGTLHPLTEIGAFTLQRLRLNRAPLVAHRLRRLQEREQERLLAEYSEILILQQNTFRQQERLLKEQQIFLSEQRQLLRILLEDI